MQSELRAKIEEMEAKIEKLKKLLENQKPICPICKSEMHPVNYTGYYDEFSYWSCNCDNFVNGTRHRGCYA